jgi:hypothetical protein
MLKNQVLKKLKKRRNQQVHRKLVRLSRNHNLKNRRKILLMKKELRDCLRSGQIKFLAMKRISSVNPKNSTNMRPLSLKLLILSNI